ncbi:hypothetical protein IAU59_005109 [Kwoniella sp. CBS 9459]
MATDMASGRPDELIFQSLRDDEGWITLVPSDQTGGTTVVVNRSTTGLLSGNPFATPSRPFDYLTRTEVRPGLFEVSHPSSHYANVSFESDSSQQLVTHDNTRMGGLLFRPETIRVFGGDTELELTHEDLGPASHTLITLQPGSEGTTPTFSGLRVAAESGHETEHTVSLKTSYDHANVNTVRAKAGDAVRATEEERCEYLSRLCGSL